MRSRVIRCDWCGKTPEGVVHVRRVEHLGAHATYDGARYDWDFCSQECMTAWEDWELLRSIGCKWSWQDPARDHQCVCRDTRYCSGNHGKQTEDGWARDCWCECGSHSPRPRDWPERRLGEHLAAERDRRLEVILARMRTGDVPYI